MQRRIGVVTDSTADIPPEVVQELGIEVIPVTVVLDGKRYRDGVDISPREFYARYHDYRSMHSEPVTYEDYALTYKRLVHQYDALIAVHVSEHLSATVNVSRRVHADFATSHTCRVAIVDSGYCSMACGLPVIAAARMAAEGRSFEEIQHLVGQMLQSMALYLAVPDLSYLRRGKKISGLKSLVGMALKVKPVLAFQEGRMVVATKLFGEQPNMILSMLNLIREDINGRPITLAITQTAADISIVRSLREVFEAEFTCRRVYEAFTSPSVGINTGPASTGVMYCKHPRGR
jgi:DegV family protein with EDD domain